MDINQMTNVKKKKKKHEKYQYIKKINDKKKKENLIQKCLYVNTTYQIIRITHAHYFYRERSRVMAGWIY